MAKRPPRQRGPAHGYRPIGEPMGYEPERNSRKAPSGYWCRYPYSNETFERVKQAKKGKRGEE